MVRKERKKLVGRMRKGKEGEEGRVRRERMEG